MSNIISSSRRLRLDPDRVISVQTLRRFTWGLIIFALALKFLSMFMAPIHPDTNYYLNIASNYFERGALTPYMWRIDPDTNIIAGSGTGYGVLLLIGWLRIFGLTVTSGNIMSYLAGLLTLVVLYQVTRQRWDDQIALTTIASLTVSTVFFRNASLRMDALGGLVYSMLLWLHLAAIQQQHRWLHFILGIAVIAAAEIHLLALVFAGAITFWYAVEYLLVLWRTRQLILLTPALFYAAGLTLATAIFIVVHILPDPQAYFIIPTTCNICIPRGLVAELVRYLSLLIYSPIDSGFIILAVVSALYRRQPQDRYFLIMLIGCVIAITIFNPPAYYIQYFGHLNPLLATGVAAFLIKGFQKRETTTLLHQRRLLTGFLLGAMLVAITLVTMRGWYTTYDPTDSRIHYIRQNFPVKTVITSRPWWYHTLIDYSNYLSYADGEIYGVKLRGEDYKTFWEREQPQVIITDAPPPQEVSELWEYMQRHGFEEVMSGLWVDPSTERLRGSD